MKWLITYEKVCSNKDEANELKKRVNINAPYYYWSDTISNISKKARM